MSKKIRHFDIAKLMYAGNRVTFALAIVFSAATALLSVAFALLLQLFVDGIGQGFEYLLGLVQVSVVFMVLFLGVGLASNYFQNEYIRRASLNLRRSVLTRLNEKSIRDFNREPSGAYLSMMTNDMAVVETNYIQSTLMIIVQLIMCVAGFAVMLYLSPILTAIVLVLSLLPMALSAVFGKKVKESQDVVTDQNRTYTSFLRDIFAGNAIIKSFHVESEVNELAGQQAFLLERKKRTNRNAIGSMMSLVQTSTFLIVLVIFGLGAYLVSLDMLTIGGIMAFLQLLNNVTAPISQIAENNTKRKSSRMVLARMDELSRPRPVAAGMVDKCKLERAIEVRDLSFSYDEDGATVLDGLSCTFEKGCAYAIVGASGCGKSTLLNLLHGYHEEYEGSIAVDGVEVSELSEESLSRLFGSIQQNPFVFDTTIRNNIALYQDFSDEKLDRAVLQAGLATVVEAKGIEALCGEGGKNLSGGECQRIAIARAVLRGNEVLLVDEATSALDSETSSYVESSLLALDKVTRIMVTHRLNEQTLRLFDAILVMRDGRIAEQGTYEELMGKRGLFYSLCQVA